MYTLLGGGHSSRFLATGARLFQRDDAPGLPLKK